MRLRRRRQRKRRKNPRHLKIKRAMDSPVDGVDFISSMPDEILHHILSFIPTHFAIRSSALSRRWTYLWCETPSLDFGRQDYSLRGVGDINQTLSSYRAPKIARFRLWIPRFADGPQIDSWVEFAVSHNVEKLSLVFDRYFNPDYRFPNLFYLSSSLEKLSIDIYMFPAECTMSWKSLRKLTLSHCDLYEDESAHESIANILSGSPVLETLRLVSCNIGLRRLDLSKSHSLRRLEINNRYGSQVPTEIVAPHIHYFYLCFRTNFDDDASCTLVDVSSLAEASLEIHMMTYYPMEGDFLQTMVLKLLAELQNVKRLTLTATVLQILSLAELIGVPFPTLKVQILTIKTRFERLFIPGISRLLHNSPELKKLIAQAKDTISIQDYYWDEHLDKYLDSQGLNPDQCWKSKYGVFPTSPEYSRMLYCTDEMLKYCKDAMLKVMVSFMEMVMTNGKALETFVLGLEYIDESAKAIWFEELLQMTTTFSNNNNVSIVLKG